MSITVSVSIKMSSCAVTMQELAECLADPMVPKFSHKFFTGGAAAAVGAQQGTNLAGEASDPGGACQQAPVVKQTVDYANKVQKNRKTAAAEQADKRKGQQGRAARQPSGPSKVSREVAEEQALQAALNRSRMKKGERQRNSRLMVVPAAFGREKHGSDALQALRAKMGVSQAAKQQ